MTARRASSSKKPCYGWQLGTRIAILPSVKRLSSAAKDAPSGALVGIWNDAENRLIPLQRKA